MGLHGGTHLELQHLRGDRRIAVVSLAWQFSEMAPENETETLVETAQHKGPVFSPQAHSTPAP